MTSPARRSPPSFRLSSRAARRAALGLLAAASPLALSHAMAQSLPAGTTITPTGDTGTQVTISSDQTAAQITTTTIQERTGFNKFRDFTIGAGFTANMVVPEAADRLVNVVSGSKVSISGIVNGYKGAVAADRFGGDIYFVAPRGFVLGAGGVVNVGKLTVATPTDKVADSLMGDAGALGRLIDDDGYSLSDAGISIEGKVNATDSVRLTSRKVDVVSGAEVVVTAGALEPDDKGAYVFKATVNTQGMTVGTAMASRGGVITIYAPDAVTVGGALSVKAAPLIDNATPDVTRTVKIESDKAITLGKGSTVQVVDLSGNAGGIVSIAAAHADSQQSGQSDSATRIDVAGAVKGGIVDIAATSSAITSYTDTAALFVLQTVGAGVFTGVNAGKQYASSSAIVAVTDGANLIGASKLTLAATSVATAEMPVVAASMTINPIQAAVVGSLLNSTADVSVSGNVALTSGADLSILATNTTKVDISAMTLNRKEGNEKAAAAIAFASTNVRTNADVGSDVIVRGGAIKVAADHHNALTVTASSMVNGDAYAGVGIAYSEQDIATTANFAGKSATDASGQPVAMGALTVTANTVTTADKTAGGTTVGTGFGGLVVVSASNAAVDKAGELGTKIYEKIRKIAPTEQVEKALGGEDNAHPRIGGGIAVAVDNQKTKASVGQAGNSIVATNDVVVAARTLNAERRDIAEASAESNDKPNADNGSTTVGIAAAVAVGIHNVDTTAEVRPGATITAGRLAVGAETIAPIDVDWAKWKGATKLMDYANANAGVANRIASGYTAANTASGKVGFGGSVDINLLTGDTLAWVGEGARVTVGAANPSKDFADGIAVDWSKVKDKALAITALTRLESIIIGGQFAPTLNGSGGDGTGKNTAIGGSFTLPKHVGGAIAGIGAEAVIAAPGGVGVNATNVDRVIAVAQASGAGSGVGVNGLVNLVDVDDKTYALIDSTATLAAASVALDANQDLGIVNIAAALPLRAEGSAVGAGIAINTINTDTQAGVIDTSAVTANTDPVSRTSEAAGITTSSLSVNAANDGFVTAFGVAGASVDNDPDRTPFKKKAATGIATALASASEHFGAAANWLGGKIDAMPTPAASGSPASFSLAGAGSAAVNVSNLQARALVQGATLDRYADSGGLRIALNAANTPVTVTGAGAGAKVSANGATSVGIGGALALDLSDNRAEAKLGSTQASNVDALTVRALNGGARVAVGLAIALNEPEKSEGAAGQKEGEAAASVSGSIVVNTDSANALVSASDIAARTDAAGVEVTAYNAPSIGAGGGAGYSGGNFGLGLAVTVVDIGDRDSTHPSTEAAIRGGTIANAGSVHVNAADPSVILALAASGGKGAAKVGVAGAGAVIVSHRTTNAAIGASGAVVAGIGVAGDVGVAATATRDATLDAVARGSAGDLSAATDYDFTGSSTIGDLRDGADGKLTLATGSAGLMIAAGGSGQKSGSAGNNAKANVGASFSAIRVTDAHRASVDRATVTAKTLDILARNDAVRVGLAIGAGSGADFGVNGSVTLAEDKGVVAASLGAADASRRTITADMVSVRADDASITAALAGSFSKAGKAALGASVAFNETSTAVSAAVTNVAIAPKTANGSVLVDAKLSGRIYDLSFAGAVSSGREAPSTDLPDFDPDKKDEGAGVALPDLDDTGAEGTSGSGGEGTLALSGASTSNIIKSNARATMTRANISEGASKTAGVAVSAADDQQVAAIAVGFARADKGAGGVALVTNRRQGDGDGTRVAAEIAGGKLDVANALVQARAAADVKAIAAGIAVGDKFSAGASIVTNIIDGDVGARIRNGAAITAADTVAILATSRDRIDVVGGSLGFSKAGGGVGISVVTSLILGDTLASVEDGTTSVSATGVGEGVEVVQGDLVKTPDDVPDAGSVFDLTQKVKTVKGVAVNASSLANVNVAALSVGAGEKAGVGGNIATTILGGATTAKVVGARVGELKTSGYQQIDVGASDHSLVNSLTGAVGASTKAGIAGAIDIALFKRNVSAFGDRANFETQSTLRIAADSTQHAFGINLGVGVGRAGIAGSVTVTQFAVATRAYLDGGRATASGLGIDAHNVTGANVATGAAGVGDAGIGGGVTYMTSSNETLAGVGVASIADGTTQRTDLKVTTTTITAEHDARLKLTTAGLGAGRAGIAAMGGVLLTSDKTRATLTDGLLKGDADSASSLSVTAREKVVADVNTGAGGAGVVGVGGAVSVGLSNNDVRADVTQSNVTIKAQSVTADATRDFGAQSVSLAAGGVGVAGSVGVLMIGAAGLDERGDGASSIISLGDSLQGQTGPDKDTAAGLTAEEIALLDASGDIDTVARTTAAPGPKHGTLAQVSASSVEGKLDVLASDVTTTKQQSGAVGVSGGGGYGVGLGVTVTTVTNTVDADIDAKSKVSGPGVTVTAIADGQAIDNQSFVGSAGGISGGAGIAYGKIDNLVEASAGGALTGTGKAAKLVIDAKDITSGSSKILNLSLGGQAAFGATFSIVDKDSTIRAGTAGDGIITAGYDSIAVKADARGAIAAQGIGAAGGGLAATAAYAKATDGSDVTATLGKGEFGYAAGGIDLLATRAPQVASNVLGVALGGTAALGASVADAFVEGNVGAMVGTGAKLNSDASNAGTDLTVSANLMRVGDAQSAQAVAQGGSGGGSLSANAAVATAKTSANVTAEVASGVKLGGGSLIVTADRQSRQYANTVGLSVAGTLSVGATAADAQAAGTITATVAGDLASNDSDALSLRELRVASGGKDELVSASISGSGGYVAGAAAIALTTNTTKVDASITDAPAPKNPKSPPPAWTVGMLAITGDYTNVNTAGADSTQAAVLGASGAIATRVVDSKVGATLGANVAVETFDAAIDAIQHTSVTGAVVPDGIDLDKDDDVVDGGVKAAAGGVLNGSAGVSTTDLTPDVTVTIGDKARLNVIGLSTGMLGDLGLKAVNYIDARDKATLDVGGAIAAAVANTRITSDTDMTVTVGEGASLVSAGKLTIASYSINAVGTDAQISTYGVVGGAGGLAESNITTEHKVDIGKDVRIRGDQVTIAAGRSGTGVDAMLSADALNDTYNWTAAAVATLPDVKARATNTSTLTIASGATVESIRDTVLTSYAGTRLATSDGTGHNPYYEAFSQTVDRSDASDSGSGTLTIDGAVTAGIQAKQTVSIDRDGDLKGTSAGIDVTRGVYKVRADLEDKIEAISKVDRSTLSPNDNASLDAQLAVFRQLLSEAPPEPLTATQRADYVAQRRTLVADRDLWKSGQKPTRPGEGESTKPSQVEIDAAVAELQGQIDGIDRQLNATTFVTTYAYTVPDIYAAAGNVSLDATTLAGSKGSVTANGGAKIAITNARPDYLVVGNLSIPVDDTGNGGFVNVTGGAKASDVKLYEVDKNVAPSIVIQNSAQTGDASIYLQGRISNIGGTIDVINQSGSIAQFSAVAGKTFSVFAPNGTYAINAPDKSYFIGGAPEATWLSSVNLAANATAGAFQVANYLYNSDPFGNILFRDEEVFTRRLLEQSCGDRCLAPILFYDLINRKNVDDGQFRWVDGGSFFSMNKIVVSDLNRGLSVKSQPALATGDGITARSLIVNARDINIAAPVKIGRVSDQSLAISAQLDGDINVIRAVAPTLSGVIDLQTLSDDYGAKLTTANGVTTYNPGRTGILDIAHRAISIISPGDKQIGAAYDFDNNRLVVNDVQSAGGGSIQLTGRIYSTSTYGALNVNGGYGDVRISNSSATPLELGEIDTGRGEVGRIKITDLAKKGATGSPVTTWYIYDNARGTTNVYNNAANGASEFYDATMMPTVAGATTAYDPILNARYSWTMTRTASRHVILGAVPDQFKVYQNAASNWTWDQSGWTIGDQSFGVDPLSAFKGFFSQQTSGGITSTNKLEDGSYANLSFNTTDRNFNWPSGRGDQSLQVTAVTGVKLTNTMSVKADNPVAITFIGNRTGSVSVASVAPVMLGGTIDNSTGRTKLSAGGNGALSTIGGVIDTLSLSATGGSIGTAATPLAIRAGSGGTLVSASANTGDVFLAVDGKASLAVIWARGSASLRATQGIVGDADNRGVNARSITLDGGDGGIAGSRFFYFPGVSTPIGVTDDALNIQTRGGEINAHARGSITLRQPTGNLNVREIASETGDVSLETTQGSIFNIVKEGTTDLLNQQRLASVAADLGLLQADSVLKSVNGFEQNVRVQQAERARIYSQTTVVGGKVIAIGRSGLSEEASDAAKAIYTNQAKADLNRDPSNKEVVAYVQKRLDAIEAFANANFGPNRPAGFDNTDPDVAFTYTLDRASARYADLTRRGWTEQQLKQTIRGSSLVPTDNTTILRQAPNIVGVIVTLTAANASIGQDQPSIKITPDQSNRITDAERAVLAAAGPGDVTQSGKSLLVSQQRLVNVSATAGINARSNDDLYIGSAHGIAVGNITTPGLVRFNVLGSITNAAIGTAAVTARDLIVEATGGGIGTAARPLGVNLSNALLSVRAGDSAYIDQIAGDLNVGVGYAGDTLRLSASKGSILSIFDNSDETRFQAGAMDFSALGAIGTTARRLQIDVVRDGALALHAASAAIYAPVGSLRVGEVKLTGAGSIGGVDLVFAGPVEAGSLNARAAGTLSVNSRATIKAGEGALDLISRGTTTIGKRAEVASKGRVRLDAGQVAIGDNAQLDGGAGLDVVARGLVQTGADVRLTSQNGALSIVAQSATLGQGTRLDMTEGHLDVAGPLSLGKQVRMTARTAELTFKADAIAMGEGVELFAVDRLDLNTNGAITAGEKTRLSARDIMVQARDGAAFGDNATIAATGRLEMAAQREIVFGRSATLTGKESATIRGVGQLTLGAESRLGSADGDIDVVAGSIASGAGTTVAAAKRISLVAQKDGVTLDDNASVTGAELTLKAAKDVTLGVSTRVTGSRIDITAGRDAYIRAGAKLTSTGAVTVAATGTLRGKNAIAVKGTDVTLRTGGALWFADDIALTASRALSATASGALTMGDRARLSGTSVNVASGGDMAIGASAAFTGTGFVKVKSAGGLTIGDNAALVGQALTVAAVRALGVGTGATLRSADLTRIAGDTVTLGRDWIGGVAPTAVTPMYDVLVEGATISAQASGMLNLSHASLNAQGGVSVSGETLRIANAKLAGTTIDVSATGDVKLRSAALTAAGVLTITAAQRLMVTNTGADPINGSKLSATGAITVSAGDVMLAADSTVAAGAALAIASRGALNAAGVLTAGDTIRLDAAGMLEVADASAGGTLTAVATGPVTVGALTSNSQDAAAIAITSDATINARSAAPALLSARVGGVRLSAGTGIGGGAMPIVVDALTVAAGTRFGDVVLTTKNGVPVTVLNRKVGTSPATPVGPIAAASSPSVGGPTR